MKKIILLLLILFISISAVSASENVSDILCDEDSISLGENVLEISNCENLYGDVIENFSDDGSVDMDSVVDDSNSSGDNGSNGTDYVADNSSQLNVTIRGEDLVWYYNANPIYKFKLEDSAGNGLSVENVSVSLNGVVTYVNTDENGTGVLPINLKAGNYVVNVTYGNYSITNTVSLFSSKITNNKDISSKYGTKVKYVLRVLDNAKNPRVGVNVTFTVGKKVYVKKTNYKGYATLWLNYASGKYTIKYSVDGMKGSNKYNVANSITMEILKWGLKGDVSKAQLIKKSMPNNYWVKKAVAATKKGIPLITIKGGKGKVVFMTSGVHGNELNSQVAAMKMIKYLTTHPIKGTVYIIPFVNVKAISKKVRLTDYDFNRVAHKAGTVSNNIIKLILKKKCDAYGDFHTTVYRGVPGINVVLGYSSPNKCIPLTNYIVKYAKVNKIVYYPGQKYTWSLADFCNLKGTPAVICEVISPVNKVSAKATNLSYKQMTGYLKFNKII